MSWHTVRGSGRGRGGGRTVGAICLFALFLPDAGGFALEEKEVVEPGKATFHEHIVPILKRSCLGCHSGRKPKGKYSMESLGKRPLPGALACSFSPQPSAGHSSAQTAWFGKEILSRPLDELLGTPTSKVWPVLGLSTWTCIPKRVGAMEPVGISKASTAKWRTNTARMTATTIASMFSLKLSKPERFALGSVSSPDISSACSG